MADEKDRIPPRVSVTPDDDDIASYRNGRKSRASDRIGDVPVVKGGRGSGGFALVLSLLTALGLGGFSYYLHEELQGTRAQLDVEQSRIERLERQLAATGEDLGEASQHIDEKLEFLDTEIRKLWDNVWRRSRQTLAEHNDRLDALEKSAKSNESQVGSTRNQVRELDGKLQTAVNRVEETRRELNSLKQTVQSGSGEGEKIAALEKRLAETEEWVESINAFRRQVNRDLDNLRSQVAQGG